MAKVAAPGRRRLMWPRPLARLGRGGLAHGGARGALLATLVVTGCQCGSGLRAPRGGASEPPALGAIAVDSGWRTVEARACGVAAELPGEPALTEPLWQLGDELKVATTYAVDSALGARFELGCVALDGRLDAQTALALAVERERAVLAGRGPGAPERYPRSLADHEGVSLVIPLAGGARLEARLFVADGRLIRVAALHDPARGAGKQVARVFESFRLANEAPPPAPAFPEAAWWTRGAAACPDGGSLAGGLPPEHAAVWCALPGGERHGPFARWQPGRGTELAELGSFYRARKHGLWVTYGASGDRNEQGYRLDVPHGAWASYYPSGGKAAEGAFRDGLMDGRSRQWAEDGTLRVDGSYDKGTKVGLWRYYGEDGALASERRYQP